MNIYSLYITVTREEREYFEYLVDYISQNKIKNLVIVHLDIYYLATVCNLKLNKKVLNYTKFIFDNEVQVSHGTFKTFEELVNIYPRFNNTFLNFFMYSGHSNGMYMMKRKVRPLRIDDFCELAYNVVGKKLDVLGFDCCLCGNINCLATCYPFTNYVIAASGYWADMSMLQTKAIYQRPTNLVNYLKQVVSETIGIELMNHDNYITNYCIYSINKYLLELIKLTLKYKDSFTIKKNYLIENCYYKDLECAFKDLGINIKGLLDKFVIYSRFKSNKCYSVKKSKKANKSYPSSLSILTKRPIKCGPPTTGDLFLRS
jgi:hypothetical protein